MKIAMLGHKRIPSREGGVEIVVEELSTRMAKLGNEVIVYNRDENNKINENKANKIKEYKGVKIKKVFTIDSKKLSAVTSSLFATIKILFSKVDVVHFHAEGPCAWMWIIKFFTRKRIIATIHGLDWQRAKWGSFATKFIKFGEKNAAKYANEIIVLSKNVQKYFKDTYNRDTVFIPNGIDKPQIREAKVIKEKFDLYKDSYILFLARIVPEKGLDYLIDAYNMIQTNKKLVIAGDASHTNKYLEKIKKKTGENKNIIMTGFVQGEMLEELFSNCYIYCLPSDIEGMPISLLEAMSFNNCCLTSDINECTEVIEDKGVKFRKSDVKDLAEKLQYLCDNKDIVNKYKIESQNFILGKYNWSEVVENTLNLYKK